MDNNSYKDDKLLIEELKKGSEVAYDYFFRSYHKQLCNYILAISGNSKLAEEIAQQAFIKIWDKRATLSIKNNGLKKYFFKMAYNLFIDYKRKVKKEFKLLEHLKQEAYSDIVAIDFNQFEHKLKLVETEIENLPDQCKKVFVMGKKEGLKYQEISEKLDISIKTVEVHMSKALKRLRTQLSPFFF
ncbi:RNA polymerase sigma factor [Maribacter sp. ACAM166]|uniref:RNA polymerase sigma factor n=1 Tax=Maribacter sp. ACAM166 TaxID=2508996 RepID=UPI0010FDD2E9|nr:RNA polymerase sigma-70 factor [Maribacter sp. ACAM166]TLP80147.1 RNA polymerase sigma-70 factor [Maribacter sp. ACAM166]